MLSQRRRGGGTECSAALFTRTERAQVIITENSRGMAIVEADLNRVVSHLRRRLCFRFRFVHRQQRGRGKILRGHGFFFAAFVVAGCARAVVAKKRKIEVAGVAVGPENIHTSSGFDVNLYFFGFLSRIKWCRHGEVLSFKSHSVAKTDSNAPRLCDCNTRLAESDSHEGKSSGGPKNCRCVGPVPG